MKQEKENTGTGSGERLVEGLGKSASKSTKASTTEPLGIIFDCDGTLLDSLGAWHNLEHELSARVGHTLSKSDIDLLTTFTIPEAAEYMHTKFGLGKNPKEIVETMNSFLLHYYESEVRARTGALDFVRALHRCGVHMSVASSNSQQYLQAGLACAGLLPYFEAVVSTDDVGKSKREPLVYNEARTRMGTYKENTWVFEDCTYALHTLKQAGYKTVGIYDSDVSGTREQLKSLANIFIECYAELPVEEFLRLTRESLGYMPI